MFRRDTPDATHMPVFHQIEGLVIDRNITMADLAGTIEAFTKAFFGRGFTSRLRPSYFPFTEPSAEFDIQRPNGDWIELGGCGMVHPNVLRAGGLDPEEWSGFAFGFGIDRMAKERHGVDDIREMFTNDIRFWSSSDEAPSVLAQRIRGLRGSDRPGRGAARRRRVDVARTRGRLDRPRSVASVAGVVTAQVLRLEQHPDAAKVQRVYVDAGDGVERHVWCGAFNMQPGDVVPMATLGTTMPDGRTIERRGILGIDSEGMLCSATELGLGDDHSGIYILPAGTPLGVPYGDALGLTPDVLIDADVTRNRPDCWGYVGVARDLAAKLGIEFRPPTPELVVDRRRSVSPRSRSPHGDRCARFTSTVISGVRGRARRRTGWRDA